MNYKLIVFTLVLALLFFSCGDKKEVPKDEMESLAMIAFVNNTDENIRIALFKKPYKQPTLLEFPWQIVSPPAKGGSTMVQIPNYYQVYVNYSFDPAERQNPYGGIRTPSISFNEFTARFLVVEEKAQDGGAVAAILKQVFTDLVANEIQIENTAPFGVWGHIQLDGNDLFRPQVITPGSVLMADVRGSFYAAVISESAPGTYPIKEEELSSQPVEVVPGDKITVTGSKWAGYNFTKS